MRGNRVVAPFHLRKNYLSNCMKTIQALFKWTLLGRSCVWWPSMDKEIQTAMKASNVCQIHCTIPDKPLINPRRNTASPWVRNIDFAGLFFWKYIFDCFKNICLFDCLIVSKCIESIQIRNIKSLLLYPFERNYSLL